ncbi:hypothetical protein AYK26_03780 [Euryarchaeota archaeon SM23-78]|nr:MAG: hypothetical protein AYK26_03780 [Euryarchaeota archaeon SM23-78]MBW3000675.1 hydrogenase maturation nickel metallochaperone HypA [Candidatus Woesearchaeota archaeon]
MHETKIIKDILKQIVKKAKDKDVKSATIEVGQLAPISAKRLGALMKRIVNFKVIIKPVKARVKCRCGYKGAPKIMFREHDFTLFECPRCKKIPRVLHGKNISLKKINVH